MAKKFGLIGKKLSHSFSQKYFTEKFLNLGLDYTYELIELQSIEDIFPYIFDSDYLGFNVTIPYKTAILHYVQLTEEVKKIGAANVIFRSENQLYAANTDVIGFIRSLQNFLTYTPKRALILGNGGASKAIQFSCNQLHIPFDVAARNPKEKELSIEQIEDFNAWDFIIQTTPIGMFPETEIALSLPYQTLNAKHFVYDLIYNPLETKFLKLAEKQGSQVKNGLEMLYAQAEAAWEIWMKSV